MYRAIEKEEEARIPHATHHFIRKTVCREKAYQERSRDGAATHSFGPETMYRAIEKGEEARIPPATHLF